MLNDPFTILIIVVAAIPGFLYLFSPAYRRKAKRIEAAWANSIAESLHRYAELFQQRRPNQRDANVEHRKDEVQRLKERIENLEAIVTWETWDEGTGIDRTEGDVSLVDEGAALERSSEEKIRQMARDRQQESAEKPRSDSREKA